MSIVTMVEEEIVHTADSDDRARAHVTFRGIPEREPTEWVEPVDC